MLPNFLVIGSQKAGTTSLYHILKQHPEIYMSETKEINFFFNTSLFAKGLQYYESFFNHAPSYKRAYGEASPGYICHPEAPERIKRCLPNSKLILIVRNPIKRAYSQYWDNRRSLSESKTFEEVIDMYLDDSYEPGRIGYFSRGVYMRYIRNYLAFFDSEQMLILLFEELLENPSEFFKTVFQFLDVSSEFKISDISRAYNPASIWANPFYNFFFSNPHYQEYFPKRLKRFLFLGEKIPYTYPDMSLKAKKQLNEFYAPWNKELSEYLGKDLSGWG